MKVSLRFDSGAKRFLNKARNLEPKLMGRLNAAFTKAGNMVKRRMVSIMASGWPANDPHYREWKVKHGYDSRPLFRTHLLANSISNIKISASPELMWSKVGWAQGAQYGGLLAQRIYTGRIPNHRKKILPVKSGGPFSRRSTMPLELVAFYNNRSRPFVDRTFNSVRPDVIAEIEKAFYGALGV